MPDLAPLRTKALLGLLLTAVVFEDRNVIPYRVLTELVVLTSAKNKGMIEG